MAATTRFPVVITRRSSEMRKHLSLRKKKKELREGVLPDTQQWSCAAASLLCNHFEPAPRRRQCCCSCCHDKNYEKMAFPLRFSSETLPPFDVSWTLKRSCSLFCLPNVDLRWQASFCSVSLEDRCSRIFFIRVVLASQAEVPWWPRLSTSEIRRTATSHPPPPARHRESRTLNFRVLVRFAKNKLVVKISLSIFDDVLWNIKFYSEWSVFWVLSCWINALVSRVVAPPCTSTWISLAKERNWTRNCRMTDRWADTGLRGRQTEMNTHGRTAGRHVGRDKQGPVDEHHTAPGQRRHCEGQGSCSY